MSEVTVIVRTASGHVAYGTLGDDLPEDVDVAAAADQMIALIAEEPWMPLVPKSGTPTWVRCSDIESFSFSKKRGEDW